jgi:hypothetical protein
MLGTRKRSARRPARILALHFPGAQCRFISKRTIALTKRLPVGVRDVAGRGQNFIQHARDERGYVTTELPLSF